VERSGRIDLTQKGRKFAEHLALRHQLAEMLLTEVIGLSWAKAHDEAEANGTCHLAGSGSSAPEALRR